MTTMRAEWHGPDGTDWLELSRGRFGIGWKVSESYHHATGAIHTDSQFFWSWKSADSYWNEAHGIVDWFVEFNWYYKKMYPHKWEVWRYN